MGLFFFAGHRPELRFERIRREKSQEGNTRGHVPGLSLANTCSEVRPQLSIVISSRGLYRACLAPLGVSINAGMVWQSHGSEVKRLRYDLAGAGCTLSSAKSPGLFCGKCCYPRILQAAENSAPGTVMRGQNCSCVVDQTGKVALRSPRNGYFRTQLCSRRAHLVNGRGQACRKNFLRRSSQLLALARQIKHVNRCLAFSVDQRHFNVALQR